MKTYLNTKRYKILAALESSKFLAGSGLGWFGPLYESCLFFDYVTRNTVASAILDRTICKIKQCFTCAPGVGGGVIGGTLPRFLQIAIAITAIALNYCAIQTLLALFIANWSDFMFVYLCIVLSGNPIAGCQSMETQEASGILHADQNT